MPGPTKKRAHKKRRAELKKQARAPGTQKGYLCCSDRFRVQDPATKLFASKKYKTKIKTEKPVAKKC
jgi:hypothetical protein